MRLLVLSIVFLAGCSQRPTAESVCRRIESSGVGKGCHEDKPEALTGRASSKWVLDLPSVPGKTGQVLSFDSDDAYRATVDAFEKAGMLAGTHRYGNAKARIFVQLNSGASLDTGRKVKVIVDAL